MEISKNLENQALLNLGLKKLQPYEKGFVLQTANRTDYTVTNYWTAYIGSFFKFDALIMVIKDESGLTHVTIATNYTNKISKSSSSATFSFGKDWNDPLIHYLTKNSLIDAYNNFNDSLIFDGTGCELTIQISGISINISLNLDVTANPEIVKIREALYSVIKQTIAASSETNLHLLDYLADLG